MSYLLIRRLKRLDFLIRLELTGTPSELAEKLEISERSVYYTIRLLKEIGADIKFDRNKNTYKYVSDKKLVIGYLPEE